MCPLCKRPGGECVNVEHRKVLESEYAHDIGLMAMGAAKTVVELKDIVEELKAEILELKAEIESLKKAVYASG